MIVFIHIPKTAGTTFYNLVKKNHSHFLKPKLENDVFKYLNNNLTNKNLGIRLPGGYITAPETLNILEGMLLDNIDFIGGHIGYGFHELVNKQQIDYLTFIRDPKSRLLSDFKEHHKPGRFFYEDLKSNGFKFNDYLKLLKNRGLDNIMTRQLAGPQDFFLKENYKVSENTLRLAIKNSKSVLIFDINRFDEAIFYLSKRYKWKYTKYKKQNVSVGLGYNLEYDEQLFFEVIKYDLELYREMKKNVLNDSGLNLFQRLQMKFNNFFVG
ncbi:sulfotransferase family 2 domain-containing protein [Aestuariibaculum suncheonense]|uniref:sulfotransferase family 2 domain-containing protein n=1 Tax=Aestuariibaculum suncheonense TaxID=1028745 RepID=UPI001660DC37|nr:sulfotransferase family 2 domain-containing protein [Aestuariibaculum suncheonense]